MQTVVLYGNSLVVSSIGASLQDYPDLQVLPLDPTLPKADQRLYALEPDIVIIDMAATQPDSLIELWKARPRLLLIGVDVTTDQALVLSSQPAQLVTTSDLWQVIANQTGDSRGG